MNKELVNIIELYNMEYNGYSYFNRDNFNKKNNYPCYIPENSEDIDDVYCYKDIEEQVEEWMKTDAFWEYTQIEDKDRNTLEHWVYYIYDLLEWEHPSTLIESLSY